MDVLKGLYEIEFALDKPNEKENIVNFMQTESGDTLYLIAEDGCVYNWKHILRMMKLKQAATDA